MAGLRDGDEALRGLLTREIADRGFAPTVEELALLAERGSDEVRAALCRLHEAHALLLHPHVCEPWVVHPFALSPGSCWVVTARHGYWANCLYCGFGIAAALRSDAQIFTRLGGESEAVCYRVADGRLLDPDGVFHLSTPAARWWDNVIHACASFQPFRSERDVDPWCARHRLPRGAVMPLKRLWAFASDWYGGYVDRPWRKRSRDEIRDVLARHGLTGPFWEI